MNYDLLVLGNDDPAFDTAVLAARSGLRVLNVLPRQRHSAAFLARSLRRLTTELAAAVPAHKRQLFRKSASPVLLQRLLTRTLNAETAQLAASLREAGVNTIRGEASFLAPGWTRVHRQTHNDAVLHARNTVIAVGSRRTLLSHSLAHRGVHTPQYILQNPSLPNEIVVVGNDDFAAALAAFCSTLGVHTQLVSRHSADSAFLELAVDAGVNLDNSLAPRLLPDCFSSAATQNHDSLPPVLDCRRTVGYTGHLRLDTLGIQTDENGLLWCSSSLESWCPGVFGAGDVVGFSPETFQNSAQQAIHILAAATRRHPNQLHAHTPPLVNA